MGKVLDGFSANEKWLVMNPTSQCDRVILDDVVSPRWKTGLGLILAAIGRDFDGVDLDIARDTTPADPANFE